MFLTRALPALLIALSAAPARPRHVQAPAPRTLIVGGGPDPKHNQVAIESNVRYLERLLPSDAKTRVLFADGRADSRTVLFTDGASRDTYRRTEIAHLDGASTLDNVKAELTSVAGDAAAAPGSPVLLYFTGHGSPDERRYENNNYDLWNEDELPVRDLSPWIQQIPHANPVVLVMVECYSGAFGNVLFRDGNPNGALTDQPICGFFASVPNRMAAGCTPNVNEADYHDFTGYFFAALSGTDRLGRSVVGADYRHDGHVGMDEAFCYSLLHDESIDTPVCTSDVFLRHFINMRDHDTFENRYTDVLDWASPAQRAALEGLSSRLRYSGDRRLHDAYDDFMHTDPNGETDRAVHLMRFVRLAKSVVLAHTLRQSSDDNLKARFESLLRLESTNPLR